MSIRGLSKREFLKTAAAGLLAAPLRAGGRAPNIIYINTDDLGYGDLAAYGSPIQTPYLDRMAEEGVRFNQFYSASAVCTPSRAALMTGRYPVRFGMSGVLWPESATGLPDSETTLAQTLKSQGYSTMCIGKWHLGSLPQFLPTSKGFDAYFGVPYSSDMGPLVLLRNTEVVEQPARLETLTERYSQEARQFIARSKDSPFFLYLAHGIPHLPFVPAQRFRGKSGFGRYGDLVRELDWSVGQVLEAVAAHGLDDNTLVMFSSDHGPWFQGSTGILRGSKAETYEGGMRVPFLARFPGRIPAGLVNWGVASSLDILPTVARLAGASLPNQPLDGVDIWPLLAGERHEIERDVLLYFDALNLQCGRLGRWKLHVARYNLPPWTPEPKVGQYNLPLRNPELYDLEADPGESYDVAEDHPQVVEDIRARMEAALAGFPGEVRRAWRDTMNTAVDYSPPGAWPVRHVSP